MTTSMLLEVMLTRKTFHRIINPPRLDSRSKVVTALYSPQRPSKNKRDSWDPLQHLPMELLLEERHNSKQTSKSLWEDDSTPALPTSEEWSNLQDQADPDTARLLARVSLRSHYRKRMMIELTPSIPNPRVCNSRSRTGVGHGWLGPVC